MTIVGFSFTKINAEKKEASKGKVDINNNVSIEKVEEKNINLASDKQKVISFVFKFTANYNPNVGKIVLDGAVLYMDDAAKVKDILDEWKKSKKLPKDIMTKILNTLLNKCNIEALILSDHISLPPPIPLPKVGPPTSAQAK